MVVPADATLVGNEPSLDSVGEELDPVDALLVMTEAPAPRAMDFVRGKFRRLKEENKELHARVADLEHTLSIVQTAQQWSLANGMSAQQAQKVREVTALLQQAKQAREEAANFSRVGRPALYEKLRAAKHTVKRERQNCAEMRERLVNAFDYARDIREQHQALLDKHQSEREGWQSLINDLRDRHRSELAKLQQALSGAGVPARTGQRISGRFDERGQEDLSALQQHLNSVQEEAGTQKEAPLPPAELGPIGEQEETVGLTDDED